jgi:hypothetical protein
MKKLEKAKINCHRKSMLNIFFIQNSIAKVNQIVHLIEIYFQ